MKVTLKAKTQHVSHDSKIRQNRKENHFTSEIVALIPNTIKGGRATAIVTVRLYNTNAKSYACVWVHDAQGTVSLSGGGNAGGYGYHRPSAAMEDALRQAGIVLSEQIGGVGDDAMERAVKAIARALTDRKFSIHVSHA